MPYIPPIFGGSVSPVAYWSTIGLSTGANPTTALW
jgi:hypothetical protein